MFVCHPRRHNGNERGFQFRRALQTLLAEEQSPDADIRQGGRATAAAVQDTLLHDYRGIKRGWIAKKYLSKVHLQIGYVL